MPIAVGTIISQLFLMYLAGKGFSEMKDWAIETKQMELMREKIGLDVEHKEDKLQAQRLFMAMMQQEKRRQERVQLEVMPALEAEKETRQALLQKTLQPSQAPSMMLRNDMNLGSIIAAGKKNKPTQPPTGLLQLLRY